jgi:hypothetical protein
MSGKMKITKTQLNKIIKEEYQKVLTEFEGFENTRVPAGGAPAQKKKEPVPAPGGLSQTRIVPEKEPAAAAEKGGPNPEALKAATTKAAALTAKLHQILQAIQGSLKEARIDFSDLIIQAGDLNEGILAAYNDVCEGVRSKTSGPIKVNWIQEEQKYLVVDGLHRIVEFIEKGKSSCMCEINWTLGQDKWKLPSKNERFKNFSLKELKTLRKKCRK